TRLCTRINTSRESTRALATADGAGNRYRGISRKRVALSHISRRATTTTQTGAACRNRLPRPRRTDAKWAPARSARPLTPPVTACLSAHAVPLVSILPHLFLRGADIVAAH